MPLPSPSPSLARTRAAPAHPAPHCPAPRARGRAAQRNLSPVPTGDAADGQGAPTPAAAAGSPDQLGRDAAIAPAPPAGGASVDRMASPLAAGGAQQGTGGNSACGHGARATAAAAASAGGGGADAADAPSAPEPDDDVPPLHYDSDAGSEAADDAPAPPPARRERHAKAVRWADQQPAACSARSTAAAAPAGDPAPRAAHGDPPPPARATAPLLSLAEPPAGGERRVLLAPVAYTRPPDAGGPRRMVVYMPTQPDMAWGVAEAATTRRRRREAMCEEAAAWLPHLGVPASLYFHAGDVATHEAPPHDEAAAGQPPPRDAVTVTALLVGVPDGDTVATTPRALREVASTTGGVWATIDALAAAATDSGGTARYRLAAAAAAKVDSFIEPTPHGPEFVRLGVRSERRANASTSARAPAATSLAARVAAVVAETRLLQTMLEEAAACPDDGDFAEFAAEVAPMVDCDAEAAIPEPLRDYELPEPPADLAVRPYRHVAVVEATEPLPAPAPQTAPPDGWWPHSVHDIVEAWALDEIAEWLQRCTTWHRRGVVVASRMAGAWLVVASVHDSSVDFFSILTRLDIST